MLCFYSGVWVVVESFLVADVSRGVKRCCAPWRDTPRWAPIAVQDAPAWRALVTAAARVASAALACWWARIWPETRGHGGRLRNEPRRCPRSGPSLPHRTRAESTQSRTEPEVPREHPRHDAQGPRGRRGLGLSPLETRPRRPSCHDPVGVRDTCGFWSQPVACGDRSSLGPLGGTRIVRRPGTRERKPAGQRPKQ